MIGDPVMNRDAVHARKCLLNTIGSLVSLKKKKKKEKEKKKKKSGRGRTSREQKGSFLKPCSAVELGWFQADQVKNQ